MKRKSKKEEKGIKEILTGRKIMCVNIRNFYDDVTHICFLLDTGDCISLDAILERIPIIKITHKSAKEQLKEINTELKKRQNEVEKINKAKNIIEATTAVLKERSKEEKK